MNNLDLAKIHYWFMNSGGGGISTFLNKLIGWFKWETDNETYIENEIGDNDREANGGQIFTGKAMSFAGATKQANLAASVNLGTVYSMSAWIKTTENGCILGELANRNWGMYVSPASLLFIIRVGGAQTNFNLTSSAYIANEWNHYTLTRNGTSFKLYINGVYKAEVTHGNNSDFILNQLRGTQASFAWLIGQVSDVRIYTTTLIQSDVDKAYNKQYVGTERNWWPLEEDSDNTTTIYDAMKANNFTMVGFDEDSFIENIKDFPNVFNKYGYAVDGTTLKPFDATTIVDEIPSLDIDGNPLVFKGQAKYHLLKVDANTVQLPDYIYDLIKGTEDYVGNTWYDSDGTGNEIAISDIIEYEKYHQYYQEDTVLFLCDSSQDITDAENVVLINEIGGLGAPENELWLLAGQSNATARGIFSEVDDYYNQNGIFEVYQADGTPEQFEVATIADTYHIGNWPRETTNFAINHILSHERLKFNKKTFFIHYAIGSTKIYEDTESIDWNVNSEDEYYDIFVSHIVAALAELTSRGISYNLKGLIWYQGFSDAAYDEAESLAHKQNTIDFLAGLRTTIPNLPVFLVKIGDSEADYKDNVRTGQEEIAAADELTTLIEVDDLGGGTLTHLTSQGLVDLAKRINVAAGFDPAVVAEVQMLDSYGDAVKDSYGNDIILPH